MWCDTPAVNLNHRVTGGSTVHSIKQEIHATGPVSPEIPTSVFVITLQRAYPHPDPWEKNPSVGFPLHSGIWQVHSRGLFTGTMLVVSTIPAVRSRGLVDL